MIVVLVILLTIVIVLVVAYGAAAAGVRFRTKEQTMPVGAPLAASDEVVVAGSPEVVREQVVQVLATHGLHPRLSTTSQVIFAPRMFPSGPLGRLVFVWFHPSIGADATETRLVIEAQELMQQRRFTFDEVPIAPPGSTRLVEAIVGALT